MSEGVESMREDVHDHNVRIALVEQAVGSIKDDIAEMKRMMSSLIEEFRKSYVPRTEFQTLEKRVDTMEARFWGLLVSVLLLFAGWVYMAVK